MLILCLKSKLVIYYASKAYANSRPYASDIWYKDIETGEGRDFRLELKCAHDSHVWTSPVRIED